MHFLDNIDDCKMHIPIPIYEALKRNMDIIKVKLLKEWKLYLIQLTKNWKVFNNNYIKIKNYYLCK